MIRAALTALSSLAVALWLGGLVALGALTAPVVFSVVSMPQSADAMTLVFRRFDLLAMTCAAIALAVEAARVLAGPRFARLDHVRAGVTTVAAALATLEGASLSPRIAALHAAGAIRGLGVAGLELSRLHDQAERCGKAEVVLLLAVLVLQAIPRSRSAS